MLTKLTIEAELQNVHAVAGFCDGPDDRLHFSKDQFDVIVSRQLVNGLFDPLIAFKNWHYWLSPGGAVVVIDGLYERSGWIGKWEEEIDVLPLSAYQTTALVPYLLEASGFHIDAVERMERANNMPSTKTTRYVVVATKVAIEPPTFLP
jgi:SAM-dependent methyltransferase